MTEPTLIPMDRFVYEGLVQRPQHDVWLSLCHSIVILAWQHELDFTHKAPRSWYAFPKDTQVVDHGRVLCYSSEAGNRYSKVTWTLGSPPHLPGNTHVYMEHEDFWRDPPSELELLPRNSKRDFVSVFERIR